MRLRPVPEAAEQARRAVGSALGRGAASWAETDVVVLLTSELVTNAIVHTGPHRDGAQVEVTVECGDEVVRVEVRDAHPAPPVVVSKDLDRPSGRGLWLVEALADRWGTNREGAGKVVWFEMAAP